MRLRLKEDPREWRKFCWVLSGVLVGVAALLVWRGRLPAGVAALYGVGGGVLALLGWWRPVWFRRTYRIAMTGSHFMGQWTGRVLLVLVYSLVLVPLGWLIRLGGKDLLQMKEHATSGPERTYWRPARPPGPLDRLF